MRGQLGAMVAACLMLAGCYLQSPYVTRDRVSSNRAGSACAAIDCNSGADGVGSANARCTEGEFENAVSEHALLATGIGEALIPLAGLVAYKGVYGKNQHHVAALSAGGAAGYALGSYLYKPNEEIYLTGVSAIECAQQMTDARRISDDDTAYLRGLLGTSSDDDLPAARAGVDERNTLSDLDTARAGRQDGLKTAKTNLVDPTCKKTARTTAEAAISNLEKRAVTTDEQIDGMHDRFAQAQSVALRLLRAQENAERDLCRATDQIRTDVNHMLTRHEADPASLVGTLSPLKYPAPVSGGGGSGGGASTGNPPASSISLVTMNLKAAVAAGCRLASDVTSLETKQKAVESAASKAEHSLALMMQRLTEIAPSDTKLDSLLKKCGVSSVEKPVPLSLSVTGTIEIAQGASYQVAITGGHSPFRPLLVSAAPKDGSIKLTLNGSDAVGNSFTVAVAAHTTVDTYNVLLIDAEGATQNFAVKVK